MTVTQFLQELTSVMNWLFSSALPSVTSAIVSNGIFLTVVILSLVTSVIFVVLHIINSIIGRKGGADD